MGGFPLTDLPLREYSAAGFQLTSALKGIAEGLRSDRDGATRFWHFWLSEDVGGLAKRGQASCAARGTPFFGLLFKGDAKGKQRVSGLGGSLKWRSPRNIDILLGKY